MLREVHGNMVGWTETESRRRKRQRERERDKENKGIKDSNCEMETDTNGGDRKRKAASSISRKFKEKFHAKWQRFAGVDLVDAKSYPKLFIWYAFIWESLTKRAQEIRNYEQ